LKHSRNFLYLRIAVIYSVIAGVTFGLWLLEKNHLGVTLNTDQIVRYGGQLAGFLAIVFLSLNFILSARYRFIENIAGGLDKMYRVHIGTGITAFTFIILHPLLLASFFLENTEVFRSFFIPYVSNNLARNLGILSFWIFVIILLIASSKRLRYHIWKVVHSFIGIPLLLAAGHVVLVDSLEGYLPLTLWSVLWITLGIWSYVYKVFLYDFVGPVFKYKVEKINKTEELFEFFLTPVNKNKWMRFTPGQFAFMQFLSKGVSIEAHPYTMSSAPDENLLRFSIKKLGDWSSQLNKVNVGDLVKVVGPYGHFNYKYLNHFSKQVWIGGGIGITPFLSMARNETTNKTSDSIFLIYSDNNKVEAVFEDEIRSYDHEASHLNTIVHFSDDEGFLNADVIESWVGSLEDTAFLICGPEVMKNKLREQLLKKGVLDRNIAFEYFNFK
jgi:predicted ferric reductase